MLDNLKLHRLSGMIYVQSIGNLSKAAALMILILRQHYLLSLLVDIEPNTPLLLHIPFNISFNDRNVFYLQIIILLLIELNNSNNNIF